MTLTIHIRKPDGTTIPHTVTVPDTFTGELHIADLEPGDMIVDGATTFQWSQFRPATDNEQAFLPIAYVVLGDEVES